MAGNWICPHCQHAVYLTDNLIQTAKVPCAIQGADTPLVVVVDFTMCPNPACRKTTLTVYHGRGSVTQGGLLNWNNSRWIKSVRLMPPTYARPMPDYVPEAVRNDYTEACAILSLSPKAAATLARRALQGMIRDFHGIKKDTLKKEIDALKGVVDPTVWQAIDAVRSIGNIGAHMEKDINVIIDVEPDEAARLVRLVEMLVRDWYVARKMREEELQAIIEIGEKKKAEKDGGAEATPPEALPPDAES